MEVLAIGNSFSQDATRYLHRIARSAGVSLNVTNLYIGGCTLERHHRNLLTGARSYALEYNGEQTHFPVSLQEALSNRRWDAVTVQQASHESFDPETYKPYIFPLVELIRKYAPKARLLVHQTWFYEEGSPRLLHMTPFATAGEMLAAVENTYLQIAREIHADGIIPSGALFGKLLEAGIPTVHRDTFHATLGLGRYALGLLWFRCLTGRSVADNPFADLDEPIPPEAWSIAKKCVDSLPPDPLFSPQ